MLPIHFIFSDNVHILSIYSCFICELQLGFHTMSVIGVLFIHNIIKALRVQSPNCLPEVILLSYLTTRRIRYLIHPLATNTLETYYCFVRVHVYLFVFLIGDLSAEV